MKLFTIFAILAFINPVVASSRNSTNISNIVLSSLGSEIPRHRSANTSLNLESASPIASVDYSAYDRKMLWQQNGLMLISFFTKGYVVTSTCLLIRLIVNYIPTPTSVFKEPLPGFFQQT